LSTSNGVPLLKTGIPGFDLVAMGGLPLNRTTLVTGSAGSAKTIFAVQFLVEGIRQADERCVFVTLEESPADIRSNMLSFGWDIARWETEGKWAFVDGSPPDSEEELIGDYDLGGLLARIHAAVVRLGARRLALDAVSMLYTRFRDQGRIRSELFRISRAIRKMNVTSMLTGERSDERGGMVRYDIEEFVADNVIILRNVLEAEQRRRSIEILKLRGAPHRRGEFPFVIINGKGIEVIPLSAIALQHQSTSLRITSGNKGLDDMCDGGLMSDSTTIVSGPTGVGKTLLATGFIAGGAAAGERCLFLSYEESREQLFRNATAWGYDFARLEDEGLLRVVCEYPESASLEDRLIGIKDLVLEFQPQRMVLDSLTSLKRLGSAKSFRDFILGLTSYTKVERIPTLLTIEVGRIVGDCEVTESNISTLADTIILLRYVELGGRLHHGITVLKIRGSHHDTEIREFTIDHQGMHIGSPFRQLHGVLTGSGQPVPAVRDRQRHRRGGRAT
jgi:circadian clock protein KaiC